MNSSKEAKSATKGLKKLQKTNKKQQQKQQLQQQQQQQQQQQPQQTINSNKNGICKAATNAKLKPNDPKANNRSNNNNNNNNISSNNYNMVQKHNNSQSLSGATEAATPNITQMFKEQYDAERRATMSQVESLPKMERTHSFRMKMSKFFNNFTGSKENLARSDESKDEPGKTPFTFTRSRSMILLRRPNRRSFIEPQLEQLSEEAEKSGDPMSPASPRKNSLAEDGAANSTCSPILRRRADTSSSVKTPARRQSAQALTSTPVEDSSESAMQRKPSLISLTPADSNYNPQLNFQKRRSSTLIASFKSTLIGLTEKQEKKEKKDKKDKLNPKWSASLQSLQAIDNMVSYANMSFIDYDKFNGYEKQLERQQSIMSLAEQMPPAHSLQLPLATTASHAHAHYSQSHSPSPLGEPNGSAVGAGAVSLPLPRTPSFVGSSSMESSPRTVVMRRKRSSSSALARQQSASTRNSSQSSFNLDTDFEHNLDRVQNVYRESLDSRTLELLNQRSRNSFIQDQPMLLDALNLEDGSANRRCALCALCAQSVARANSFKQQRDAVDGRGKPKIQLKSKSLTHLDGLDTPVPACQHGAAAPTTTAETFTTPGMSAPTDTPGQQTQSGEFRQAPKVCKPHPHTTPTTIPPPTIYTQAPQFVRRSPSLMLSPNSCQAGIGSGARCSVSSAQQPACSSATGTTYLTPTSKNLQSQTSDILQSSPIGSGSSIPYSYYGGSKTVASTTMTSSLIHRKKPLLTRSEVSSSEYFSVSFCLEASPCPDEEFIPATKGTTLQNALRHMLHRRNLSFSQIKITDNIPTFSYLDTGPSNMTSLLDEYTDVENLAGHHLVITERDSSRKSLQKAASFGSRQRPPRLLSSASTEETSESGNATGKQILGRWSSIFGIKNPQQSQLYDLLNNYAKNGVPQRPDAFSSDNPALADALNYLQNMDKSWRDFVDSNAMSDSEIKIQTAIWELVTTEVYYIHALQTVTHLFLACLEAVQEERLLTDVDQHRLFSNVRSVCEANIKFWTQCLYPMVAHSIRTHEPLRYAFFQEGFITFASIFAPYKVYCAEQSTCQFYCKELNQNNALFTVYLAWCESQKMCNRLRLADIVVRPMQRLTKYSLLLAAIKKHMTDVEDIEVMDIMIHSVENFVGSVNNHLTMRQESERLKGVMARIESYDVVDTNNEVLDKLIKQHSQMFDLCAPMRGCPVNQVRHLFMEGDHKFKDNVGKSDVHCFLLTDILLVCKGMAKKGLGALKVIRQPYLTDHLIVQLAHNNTLNCVYLNEFQVPTTGFTLQCIEAKNWYDALRRAKTIYLKLKQGYGGDTIRYGGSATGGGTGDSLLVRKSPINSSIGSHVSSANNSHSGSVEWNDSRNISVDFEKTNSLSSDEGSSLMGNQGLASKGKQHLLRGAPKQKIGTIASTSANTLSVQPLNHLGQSLPNLNLQHNQTVPLKRGMAFSTSTKNPPLLKTRNITSQNSINWHQIPATPTPPSPRSQHNSPSSADPRLLQKQISHQMPLQTTKQSNLDLQRNLSNETDV
ncbi:uncharacterized protein LOC111601002 isoform X3 [Drosophila hydei]|uniref:Uncharacterized protein LOC111601002 isoform X3 n=1 Tax=Drosophila hydei TaxID=7224 RepID=A0A6J2SXT4_DROHY|nr:uncharacterized protein LOC111601002 isoform X3 [Drosophila hydei]